MPGYISLEQARLQALEHARDNTDFYGPRYRNKRLRLGASISGTVFDAYTGKPLADVKVQRDFIEGGPYGSTLTDGLRRYAFSELSPGEYHVWTDAMDRGYAEQYYSGRVFWASPTWSPCRAQEIRPESISP